MNFFQHPDCNAVLAAPPGMSNDECRALPITRTHWTPALPAMLSYWKPSDLELKALNEGGHVVLHVLGTAHPPVALLVEEK